VYTHTQLKAARHYKTNRWTEN